MIMVKNLTITINNEKKKLIQEKFLANVDFRLKEIMNFAATSIEGFQTNNIPWCVGESEFYCRLQYMLDVIDLRYTGFR